MLFGLLALVAVLGSTWWLYSDLSRRRVSKGVAFGISLGLMAVVYFIASGIAAWLLGWVPLFGHWVPPVAGSGATVLFSSGFARPLSKQLRKGR